VVATGNAVGSVTADFSLLDQHGQQVRLHDFCGREVLMVTSAMWCGPCQAEAPEMQHWYDTYEAQGFIVITLLGEDEYGNAPDQADLMAWATAYGLKHPVLSDSGWGVSNRWPGNYIPTMHLLAAGATVIGGNSYFDEIDVQANLP
jgi:peroxiredoxin